MKAMILCTGALIGWALSAAAVEETFQNPLNPSADPWLGFVDGEYHLSTTQGDSVKLWSSKSIVGLRSATPEIIWKSGKGVWAAEFHHLPTEGGRRWFCYFTKTDGEDVRHRMFVMQSTSASIKGPYGEPKLLLTDPDDQFYAIDGHVLNHAGNLYFLWAGHPGHLLYISQMKDPFTLTGERVMIPASGFGCEEVREGPYVIARGERLFLTYSACDTQKPDYKVGYLWADAKSDLMKVDSWTQHAQPLLERRDTNHVFGPGHHGFFKSPDGREDWIVYHGKTSAEYTYRGRSTRAQRLEWDERGFPKPVVPFALGDKIPLPSGDRGEVR
jgi:GH43 family beta-xylosidase